MFPVRMLKLENVSNAPLIKVAFKLFFLIEITSLGAAVHFRTKLIT